MSPNCTASYPSLAGVLRCVTTHGPALRTVTGTTWPSGRNTCVIPTFFPKIPGLMLHSYPLPQALYLSQRRKARKDSLGFLYVLCAFARDKYSGEVDTLLASSKGLDFHIHASR